VEAEVEVEAAAEVEVEAVAEVEVEEVQVVVEVEVEAGGGAGARLPMQRRAARACSSATSSGRFSSFALSVMSGSVPTLDEAWPLELPASRDGARRFCRLSSFFSLRICTLVASRRRRLSSWSMPFLNCCFRSSCFRIIVLRPHSRAQSRAPPNGRPPAAATRSST